MGILIPYRPFQILVAMRSEETGEIFWVAGRVTREHGQITVGFTREVPPFRDQSPGPWRATVDAVIETPQRGWSRGSPVWPDIPQQAIEAPKIALPASTADSTD